MEDAFQGAVRGGLRLKRTSGVVNVSAKKQKKAKSRKGRQEQDALEREEVAVVDEKGIPCEAPANAAARPAPPTARSEEAEEKGDEAGARASSEGSASKSPEERRGSPAAGEGITRETLGFAVLCTQAVCFFRPVLLIEHFSLLRGTRGAPTRNGSVVD